MSILVIAEHDNATLKAATLNTVTAATQLGDEVTVLVAGHNCGAAAQAAAKIAGVKKVLHADAVTDGSDIHAVLNGYVSIGKVRCAQSQLTTAALPRTHVSGGI